MKTIFQQGLNSLLENVHPTSYTTLFRVCFEKKSRWLRYFLNL